MTDETGHYDVDGFLGGSSALTTTIRSEVRPVDGLDLLHLQCHFGLESLSFAREGARVTGVDFSPAAIEHARLLAAQAGIPATFVEADTQELPTSLDGQFDLVFASYGTLCWVASLDAWFQGAFRALRPNGKLILLEIHPLMLMTDSASPLVFGSVYLGGAAQVFQWEGTYAGGAASVSQPAVGYPHGVGEVVTAAARAGFVIEDLTEHLRDDKEHRPDVLVRDPDGWYRLSVAGQDLPVAYSLRATRAA
ncbi:class I SAM-dependent methyltransferase [Kribbella sp. NBC_01505]|uniref:class I SAM-dependent methyltransferase n=1 Tax=Kribbella sp. NBC_01505 TaxID=2903580 RepID=UPI003866CC38